MAKKPIVLDKRIARPYLVVYRRANRWFTFAGKTAEEAFEKVDRLLQSGQSKMCIVTKIQYNAQLGTLPEETEDNAT